MRPGRPRAPGRVAGRGAAAAPGGRRRGAPAGAAGWPRAAGGARGRCRRRGGAPRAPVGAAGRGRGRRPAGRPRGAGGAGAPGAVAVGPPAPRRRPGGDRSDAGSARPLGHGLGGADESRPLGARDQPGGGASAGAPTPAGATPAGSRRRPRPQMRAPARQRAPAPGRGGAGEPGGQRGTVGADLGRRGCRVSCASRPSSCWTCSEDCPRARAASRSREPGRNTAGQGSPAR